MSIQKVDPKLAAKTKYMRWIMYAILILTYIFVYFDRVAPAVVAPDLAKEFTLNAASLGLLSALYFYPYAAMQIPSGFLADRLGPRLSVSIFFLIAAVGTAVFGLAPTYKIALLGRALMGIGVAVVYLPIVRLVRNWFRPREFTTLIGLMLTWGNIGAILAAAPLAWLAGQVGWRNSFFYLGVVMVALSFVNFFFLKNSPKDAGLPSMSEIDGIDYYGNNGASAPAKVSMGEALKLIFANPNYKWISIYMFVIYGSIMGFQGLWSVPFLIDTYGVTKQVAGNIIMFWGIGFAVGAPIFGWLTDKIIGSPKKTLIIGAIGYIILWIPFLFFAKSVSIGALYPLIFLLGAFCSSYVCGVPHITADLPKAIGATAAGMINIWCFIGGAVYQQIIGKILDGYTKVNGHFPLEAYQSAFMIMVGTLVVGTVVYFFTNDTLGDAFKKEKAAKASLNA